MLRLLDPFASVAARDAIGALRDNGNTIGCYISSGTCEDWRADYDEMKPHCVEQQWGEWPGEYFVDAPSDGLVAIMQARIDSMAAWGCDLVEFDNMDWAFDDDLRSQYGFAATAESAIAYNQLLCEYTHTQGMLCMAKNTREGAETFDGGTFESYPEKRDWWPHGDLAGFLDSDQLGIVVHYDEGDCDAVYADYAVDYGGGVSFICESRSAQSYRHYNE